MPSERKPGGYHPVDTGADEHMNSISPAIEVPEDDAPHVLVVDDDARLRDLLTRYLSGNGFRVSNAADAAEARRKLNHIEFDLLVVDIMMPGENGISFTSSLRENAADVPVLMLTARENVESRIEGLEAGADDYMPKPFEPRELLLRINSILRRTLKPEEPACRHAHCFSLSSQCQAFPGSSTSRSGRII